MSQTLLEVKNLHVHYSTDNKLVHAVNGINIKLNEGESLGIVGETGAGKTTSALSLMRLVQQPAGQIKSGQVMFKGTDLLAQPESFLRKIRGNDIAMIFQDPMTTLNPVYTVGDQIAEMIWVHEDMSRNEARTKAGSILEMVGIPAERAAEYPHQFSGGMRQRVGIAMGIACDPSLLIADEPTTALDVTIQAQVLDLIKGLKERLNTALILITHDLGIVAEICDRVAIMYAGEIIEHGTLEEIFLQPSHPYTKGLFNSIPSLDKNVRRLEPIKGLMPDPSDLPSGCPFHPRCPVAMDKCSKVKPDQYELDGQHKVACLLFHNH